MKAIARRAFRAALSLACSIAGVLVPSPGGCKDLVELSIEELLRVQVSTSSKRLEELHHSPGVITVVTRKEIEEFGAVSLVDVLNRVPSLQMMSSHLWVQAKPVIRGNLITHADHHTLVLINGRPVRDAMEANSNFTVYTAFPVSLIERIEVVRGPGSVLYGSNAMAGVINIITREPEAEPAAVVSAGAGSFGAELGSGETYWSGGAWSLALAFNRFVEDGWDLEATTDHPSPALGPVTDRLRYGESNESVAAVVDYKDRFRAQIFHADMEYDAIGVLPYWPFQGTVGGRRTFLDLGYAHPLPGGWELSADLGFNAWEKHIVERTTGEDNQDDALATLVEISASGPLGDAAHLVVGLLTEMRENRDLVEPIPSRQSNGIPIRYEEDHYSAYAQLEHRATDALTLVGGAQFNRTDSGASDVVPRAGLIYELRPGTTFKLLYGQAFRTATPIEEYIEVGGLVGEPSLRPEKGETFDAQLFLDTVGGQYTFTLFHTSFTDLVERVSTPDRPGVQTFDNAGRKELYGLEIEGKRYLTEDLYLTGSVTLQREEAESLFIPDHMLKAGIAYRTGPVTAGAFYSHLGAPRENQPLGGLRINPPADAIGLLSANLTFRFHWRTDVALNLYGSNLLDDDMAYTEFTRGWVNTLPVGPGRAVYGRITVEF